MHINEWAAERIRRMLRARRLVALLPVAALVAGLGAGSAGTASASPALAARVIPGPVVPASLFGMTIGSAGSLASLPIKPGSLRLWDTGVRWDQVQAKGRFTPYDWTLFDKVIRNAKAAGIKDIEYVMGSTPRWAAIPASSTIEKSDLYGPGTASYPANVAYYLNYLTYVATRYCGIITSFEVWNEANLKIFYRGSAANLAALTRAAYVTLKHLPLTAAWRAKRCPTTAPLLVGASITILGVMGKGLYSSYLTALRSVSWPVDAFSAHLYPTSPYGPDYRVTFIGMVRRFLTAYGSTKPLWDGEVNYGDARAGYVYKRFSGLTADAYVARTYIDSMRYGVARTYWYSWEVPFLGINMSIAGKPTEASYAFNTIKTWMVGKHWEGCLVLTGGINRCQLLDAVGHHTSIWYATSGTRTIKIPNGTIAVCRLPTSLCTPVRAGTNLTLNFVPVLTYDAYRLATLVSGTTATAIPAAVRRTVPKGPLVSFAVVVAQAKLARSGKETYSGHVKLLQAALIKAKMTPKIIADGFLGVQTLYAYASWQRTRRVPCPGIPDLVSFRLLGTMSGLYNPGS
jgi:hypothetical protein